METSDLVWVDNNTFISKEVGHCFFCHAPTSRVDINYGAYYCGEDDEDIEADIRSLDG